MLIVVNAFLLNVPLTNSLGFEFAFVNGIILFFAGGFFSISLIKKKDFISLKNIYSKEYVIKSVIIVTVPFIMGLLGSIIFTRCPFFDGVQFYLLIPLLSFYFGFVLGVFSNSISNAYSRLIFILLTLILLLIPLYEFYFNPQIYFYNPLFGFYPGTIYDEDVSVSSTLVMYRLLNIAVFTLLLFAALRINRLDKIKKIIAHGIILLAASSLFLLKPMFAFSTDSSRLKRNLTNLISTEHFNIYVGDSVKTSEQKHIALLHEYYYDQLRILFDDKPEERLTSYIYNNKVQKRLLFGSGNADVAKPWQQSIHINYQSYEQTLKHELIHIYAAKYGVTPFKVADGINMAVTEGFAVAFENMDDYYSTRQMAKLAIDNGYKVPFKKLFTGLSFFNSYSSVAYLNSGAFIQYLYSTYGIEKIKKLYGNIDFENVFGKSIDELETEFMQNISKDTTETNTFKAQLYFGGTTIFKKFCPRMAANDMKHAAVLYQSKKYNQSLAYYKKIYNYSSSVGALIGIASLLTNLNRKSEAISFIEKKLPLYLKSQYYFYLELMLADLYIKNNELLKADALYEQLLFQRASIHYQNDVKTKKYILKNEGIDSLKTYLKQNEQNRILKYDRLNKDSIICYTIPSIIDIVSKGKYNSKVIDKIKPGMLSLANEESVFANISLANYHLKIGNYQKAKDFAINSLQHKQIKTYEHYALETLRKVNWFFNNNLETSIRYGKSK